MRSIIDKANILRTDWPGVQSLEDSGYVNLYLGSGRFGGCFDAFGLMSRPFATWTKDELRKMKYSGEWEPARMANTVFMHADHWSRGAYGLDCHLPVGRLAWAQEMDASKDDYHQTLSLYDGRLVTHYKTPHAAITVTSSFNPYNRDVFALRVAYTTVVGYSLPEMKLLLQTEVESQYENYFKGSFVRTDRCEDAGAWTGLLSIGTARTVISVRVVSEKGSVVLSDSNDGLQMAFAGDAGVHTILLGIANRERAEELNTALRYAVNESDYFEACADAWHKRWGNGWVSIPDEQYQSLWTRSVYYLLCSYSPDADCVAPPCGWSGNGWGFHFAQDFSYIHPALLRLGHLDIAKSKVEFYRKRLDDVKRNTKRLYGVDGALWPWEFPIGPGFNLFEKSAPNVFQFEIHNAAYPVRMAYETSCQLNDAEWTKETAWPIIVESTRFFVSLLTQETDGTWGLHVKPSMGQDEAGGFNANNYLCALFSCKYCLNSAITLSAQLGICDEETAKWRRICENGLAFTKIYSPTDGIYYTCEEALAHKKPAQKVKQKHPVQLNPLIFLPLGNPDEALKNAYANRYSLCYGVNEDFIPGWTLGAFWLAACHMQDGEAMLKEFNQILQKDYADENMLQLYESSRYYWMQYYTTTHGLYVQAVNDAVMNDYWGDVKIGSACPPIWQDICFNGLRTMDGRSYSGKYEAGEWQWHVTENPSCIGY